MRKFDLRDQGSNCLKNYHDNGIALIPPRKSARNAWNGPSDFIQRAREKLEDEFISSEFPQTLNISDVKDQELIHLLYDFLRESNLQSFFKELENQYKTPVSLFPNVIQRNLFPKIVDRHIHNHDWHRDNAGMLNYEYCKNDLRSHDYIFGKVQIAFQSNTYYGGGIDIIRCSNQEGSFRVSLFNKLSGLLRRLQLGGKSFCNKYLFDYAAELICGAERVMSSPGDVVVFNNKVLHRSTPIRPSNFIELKPLGCSEKSAIPLNINLRSNNKYVAYFHFGSPAGLRSYIYQQIAESRQKVSDIGKWQKMKKCWNKEFNTSPIYTNLFCQSKAIFDDCIQTIEGFDA